MLSEKVLGFQLKDAEEGECWEKGETQNFPEKGHKTFIVREDKLVPAISLEWLEGILCRKKSKSIGTKCVFWRKKGCKMPDCWNKKLLLLAKKSTAAAIATEKMEVLKWKKKKQ